MFGVATVFALVALLLVTTLVRVRARGAVEPTTIDGSRDGAWVDALHAVEAA